MEAYLRDERGKIILDESGIPVPAEAGLDYHEKRRKEMLRPATPLSRIGKANPGGVWEDLKSWWAGRPDWQRYTIIGAPVLVGLIVAAAAGKDEGKAGLKKL